MVAMRSPATKREDVTEGEDVTALSPEKRKRIHDVYQTYEHAVNAMEQALISELTDELGITASTALRVWNNAYSGVTWDDETVYVGQHRRD